MSGIVQHKAIFFDRDGTLIVDKVYLNNPDEIVYIDGIFPALKKMRDLGFIFVVVTNQSGIPRGLVQPKNLEEIHRRIGAEFQRHGLEIVNFYYAPYLTDNDHVLRKPNPGMLLEGARDYHVQLSASYMIGDRMVDVEAGHRAGCSSIMVGQREKAEDFLWHPPEFVCPSVVEAVEWIVERETEKATSSKVEV